MRPCGSGHVSHLPSVPSSSAQTKELRLVSDGFLDGVDWHRALLRDFPGGDHCGSGWWPRGVLLPESWLLTLTWSWSRCGRRQLSMSSEMGSPQLAPQDTQPRGREPGPEPAQLAAHSPSVWVPCESQGSCSICPGSWEPSPGLLGKSLGSQLGEGGQTHVLSPRSVSRSGWAAPPPHPGHKHVLRPRRPPEP